MDLRQDFEIALSEPHPLDGHESHVHPLAARRKADSMAQGHSLPRSNL